MLFTPFPGGLSPWGEVKGWRQILAHIVDVQAMNGSGFLVDKRWAVEILAHITLEHAGVWGHNNLSFDVAQKTHLLLAWDYSPLLDYARADNAPSVFRRNIKGWIEVYHPAFLSAYYAEHPERGE